MLNFYSGKWHIEYNGKIYKVNNKETKKTRGFIKYEKAVEYMERNKEDSKYIQYLNKKVRQHA